MNTFRAIYNRTPSGRFQVEVLGLRGCHTEGNTLEEARDRIRQLLAIYFPNEQFVITDEYGDSLKDR